MAPDEYTPARYVHGAARPDRLTPGMYSCVNQMLFARLLRSIVTSSLDEVAPSCVNGTLCLPTVTTAFGCFCQAT